MNGFVNVYKPSGMSSAFCVWLVKRAFGVPCGHMGTLDPMASGVLPIALGNASRLFDYFLTKRKTYVTTFIFGSDSDTLDTTGVITEQGGYVPCEEEIIKIIPSLCGEVLQIPPKYSAKNINGKRGYMLAREGVEFELSPKKVDIYGIKLLDRVSGNAYSFEIECGGGTYIRSIARDMGAKLGTCAIMSALSRTKSGCFNLEHSVKTENLTAENIEKYIIATDSVLTYDSIKPTDREAFKLFNGLSVESGLSDGVYKIYYTDGSFYGLAEVKDNLLKVRTKLC